MEIAVYKRHGRNIHNIDLGQPFDNQTSSFFDMSYKW